MHDTFREWLRKDYPWYWRALEHGHMTPTIRRELDQMKAAWKAASEQVSPRDETGRTSESEATK